jgi:hypothetical protein
MSVKIQSLIWDRYEGEGNEMLVALALGDWANDNGEGIYPALATLARKSRQSESSARRHVKQMLERGWLLRVNRGVGGRGVTSEYKINPDWLKGVNLTPFHVEQDGGVKQGAGTPVEPQLKGSPTPENPSTIAAGYSGNNPSNLTPFAGGNPSNLTGNPTERVSNRPEKGVTAMTPDPLEPKNSDARAPARGRARATSEPEPARSADPASVRGWWRTLVLGEFSTELQCAMPEYCRVPLDRLPTRLRQLITQAAEPIVERFSETELRAGGGRMGLDGSARAEARDEAKVVVSLYRSALAGAAA